MIFEVDIRPVDIFELLEKCSAAKMSAQLLTTVNVSINDFNVFFHIADKSALLFKYAHTHIEMAVIMRNRTETNDNYACVESI